MSQEVKESKKLSLQQLFSAVYILDSVVAAGL